MGLSFAGCDKLQDWAMVNGCPWDYTIVRGSHATLHPLFGAGTPHPVYLA
jgi:hypothetical protein